MIKKKETKNEIKEEIIIKKEVPDFYVISRGETLEDVSKKFELNVEDLKKLNGEVIGGNQIRLK